MPSIDRLSGPYAEVGRIRLFLRDHAGAHALDSRRWTRPAELDGRVRLSTLAGLDPAPVDSRMSPHDTS